jgi:hypothetical protein
MHSFARTSLGLLALTLISPIIAKAQDALPSAPAGYQPATSASSPAPVPVAAPLGLDGQPVPAAPAEPVHQHKGRTLCAKCAAKQASAPPPGAIVGCAHSKNGVCTACQAALRGPGQFVMVGAPAAEAPGRAVASSGPAGAHPGMNGSAVGYEGAAGDPVPVGVIQANFSQSNPVGAPSSIAPPAEQPGRAVAESTAGHEPYQTKSGSFPRPHILGHLFGWSLMGADRAEEKARRKAEAHAMIAYDSEGKSSTPVEDLPASVVYGKKH